MSIIEQLAVIRERQGLSPLPDPRIIGGPPMAPRPLPEGFGEPTATRQDPFDEEGDSMPGEDRPRQMFATEAVSPLVAAAKPKEFPPGRFERLPEVQPILTLCVFDSEAAYQGRPVTLTDKELTGVKVIVCKALQRLARQDLASLVKLTPKRARRARTVPSVTPETAPEAPVRKKRGRPRGSLLAKKA
jgi:hypothetical protein